MRKNEVETQSVKIWEDYQMNGFLHERVRSDIADSWIKSKKLGISAEIASIPVASEDSYKHLIEQNRNFLNAAEPVVQNLKVYMENSSSMIELFDSRGMIMRIYGNRQIISQAEKINNIPGGNWDNNVSGTNAVGLALEHKKPFMVVGAEHYCKVAHDWTCLAFPVRNGSTNDIIGILDVTGPHQVFYPHSFGLIQSSAFAIEKILDEKNLRMDLQLLEYYYIQQVSLGVASSMAINKFKNIIRCTEKAAAILQVMPASCLGKSIHSLGIPQLSHYMDIEELEVEFYTSLLEGIDIRIVLKQVMQNHEFLGWLINFYPIQRLLPKKEKIAITFDSLIGLSPPFRSSVELGMRIASSDAPVLLLGETGTGKEMFARAIHESSNRRNGPFIALNCGSIPRELIASELFGYEEGAFTGTKKGGKLGCFELANGGTLFLDEIGELPIDQQVYLLRALQEKSVMRLGGNAEIPVNVRIISATNVVLYDAVHRKEFRQDLYFRLNVVSIELPTLRKRGAVDILKLATHFLLIYSRKEGKNVSLSNGIIDCLSKYDWPGNVRELENLIYRLVVYAVGNIVNVENLPMEISSCSFELDDKVEEEDTPPINVSEIISPKKMEEIEREQILETIVRNRGNYSKAAVDLGISRSTIYRKLDKLPN